MDVAGLREDLTVQIAKSLMGGVIANCRWLWLQHLGNQPVVNPIVVLSNSMFTSTYTTTTGYIHQVTYVDLS